MGESAFEQGHRDMHETIELLRRLPPVFQDCGQQRGLFWAQLAQIYQSKGYQAAEELTAARNRHGS